MVHRYIKIYIECNIQEEEKEDDDCVEVFSECAPLERIHPNFLQYRGLSPSDTHLQLRNWIGGLKYIHGV